MGLVVLDFETKGIEARPAYPPEPVGVAIKLPDERRPRYFAWGHPTGNNSTKGVAGALLQRVFEGSDDILCHNAKFDIDVANTHFGLAIPNWTRLHDTMYRLFLADPHSETLSLKPSAERLFGMKPDEQNAVADWLLKNLGIRGDKAAGANIWRAPGSLVGKYAIGDIVRTLKIEKHLAKTTSGPAYDRERRLMPILLDNERRGMRFDVERAALQVPLYEKASLDADNWLRHRLKTPGLNLDADMQVAEALDRAGVVTTWAWTAGGAGRKPQRSMARKNLGVERFADPEVFRVLGYRTRLQTVLALNLKPWLEMAQANGGKIFTEWNQVRRQRDGGDTSGTRTGRLSCSRFQNISKDFDDKGDGYEHPKSLVLPRLPLVRDYLLPDAGETFVHRDYNQQEFRILAHYEDGPLRDSYIADPKIDYHNLMQTRIKTLCGINYPRRLIKAINFALNYGTGVPKLAEMAHIEISVAKELRAAAKTAAPGVEALQMELKRRGKSGQSLRTWGGREYFCEPARYSETHQRWVTFEYRLLNVLIQGSAADCTKEAMIRYHEKYRKKGRMLVTVHDEINLSVPTEHAKAESDRLRQAMESIEFDVPMLTDAKYGPSWGQLKKEEI